MHNFVISRYLTELPLLFLAFLFNENVGVASILSDWRLIECSIFLKKNLY